MGDHRYCSICGRKQHHGHCSKRTYAGKDGWDGREPVQRVLSFNERLHQGVRMLRGMDGFDHDRQAGDGDDDFDCGGGLVLAADSQRIRTGLRTPTGVILRPLDWHKYSDGHA